MNGSTRRKAIGVAIGAMLISLALIPPTATGAQPRHPVVAALAAPRIAAAGQSEPLPDYFYGSVSIPPGQFAARVYSRFVTPASVVFLSVDTTTWPQSDLSLPNLIIAGQGDGFFDAKAGTNTAVGAPGIPFNYVVFDNRSTGPFVVGDDGSIPGGQYNAAKNDPTVKATSEVFLTPRIVTGESQRALPPLKVNNHGAGFFTVTTTSNQIPDGGEHFNYLIVNETANGCTTICGSKVLPAGGPNVGVSTAAASAPAMVLLTEDITKLPADAALPAIKVNNHGAGFFTVTTDNMQNAPGTAQGGIPFNWLVLQPRHEWEEYGPTGRSGNTWTIAADASDPQHTWYVGSMHGGVWKTSDGGDTWYSAWRNAANQPLPMFGIYAISVSPARSLWAITDTGEVFKSTNHGLNWTQITPAAPVLLRGTQGPYGGGVFIVADSSDTPYVCGEDGLLKLSGGTWAAVGTGPTGSLRCSHVLFDGSTVYAAFRGSGLYQLQSDNTWKQLKGFVGAVDAPIRIAVNATTMVVNDSCSVWIRKRSELAQASATVMASWGNAVAGTNENGKVCDEPTGGSSTTAAITPNGKLVMAGGRGAWLSTDSGATFPTHLFTDTPTTGETRGALVLDDSTILAAVDGGIRFTRDAGAHWLEADHRAANMDGPPNTEFYNLAVSAPNQFGQVLVDGAVQDIGGIGMLDRPTGFYCCTGEWGRVGVATKPTDTTTAGNPTSTATMFATSYSDLEGGNEVGTKSGKAAKSVTYCSFTTSLAPPTHADGPEGYSPNGACGRTAAFDGGDTITVIASSPRATNAVVVGGSLGSVVAGSPSKTTLTFASALAATNDAVTALSVVSDTVAYVGFNSGKVVRIDDVFGAHTAKPIAIPNAPGTAVVGFANRYGDAREVYAAYSKQVFTSIDGGQSWTPTLPAASNPAPGPGVQPASIADAVAVSDVAGLVRDPDHALVYLAFGRKLGPTADKAYAEWDYAPGSVWFASAPVGFSARWTAMSEGLPPSTPITGIGISPNKALFIATQGRGIWWRRDVISGLPNSGVNEPARGSSKVGETVVFDTRCAYEGGWRHINTLEFKLAAGHGPQDAAPAALWVAVDTKRRVVRLYDPHSSRWLEGAPGSRKTLSTRYATLHLDRTSFEEAAGESPPTVDIRWAVTLKAASAGDLQQYLKVTDDKGSATSWDRVGSWRVRPRSSSRGVVVGAVAAGVVAVGLVALGIVRRRRRTPV